MNIANPLMVLWAVPCIWLMLRYVPRNFLRSPERDASGQRRAPLQLLRPLALLRLLGAQFSLLRLPRTLYICAILAVGVALTGPNIPVPGKKEKKEQGRAFVLALDNSISMGEEFKGPMPALTYQRPFFEDESDVTPNPQGRPQRRIDVGLAVVLQFVEHRMGSKLQDSCALLTFARRPRLCVPMDTQLEQIRRHGSFIPSTKRGDGLEPYTNFGKEIPGPIDAGVQEFKYSESTTRVMILITDGEDEIKDDVQARLSGVLKDAGVTNFYVIGIGPKLKDENADIQKLCRQVGGKVFHAETAQELQQCMDAIDLLESAPVKGFAEVLADPLFWLPLSIALVLVALAATLESLLFGR